MEELLKAFILRYLGVRPDAHEWRAELVAPPVFTERAKLSPDEGFLVRWDTKGRLWAMPVAKLLRR